MRNTNDIPKAEFEERINKSRRLLADPYRKALQNRQSEIFSNPDCNEWKVESGQNSFGLKPEYQKEWDDINEQLELYRKHLYPELVFRIEDEEKLNEVELLKADEEYDNLVKGLKYHSADIEVNDNAISEIIELNEQISDLIDRKFPDLFNK